MTESQLIVEGVNLMFVGMGFVILFLLLLIGAITLMSRLINRFFSDAVSPQNPPVVQPQAVSDDAAHLRPVIIAAINHHRRQQGIHE
ncbi:oxaloacetate decarboxylase subunit gamma [Muribacter muris]|uniref:Probable oxaloacetate decarboxylase gamma chain n=1 Tax=Muribacter muris TaxID=67855 RepID=A0A4Y9JZP7_9PAST|nr:oxaloacetate decarboxylase subunit gamma [Muribacter muris]MBF0785139.1 oxaloacetate decarboxylase subunit gamma [Muribacter muris]MBF0826847.1 oxaloacetate decarboxylase subunit gamma [Muribacter muris]TFV10230.1 oxaloacetate decarboxylase subunit gamma [Muribacter muris]